MAGDVVGRSRGASQDEAPGPPTFIGSGAHVIPYLGCELPLVKQARLGARKESGRVHTGCGSSPGIAGEQDLAASVLASR